MVRNLVLFGTFVVVIVWLWTVAVAVDSSGEASEETAVQNGRHATWAHRGGASQKAHACTSLQQVFLTFSIFCTQPLLAC